MKEAQKNAVMNDELAELIIHVAKDFENKDKSDYFKVDRTIRQSNFPISEKAYKLLLQFGDFFDAIVDYAKRNYIYPTQKKYFLYTTSSYIVLINGVTIELGIYKARKIDTLFFKIPESTSGLGILMDLEFIKKDDLTVRAERISYNLSIFKPIVEKYVEMGVPKEAMYELLESL